MELPLYCHELIFSGDTIFFELELFALINANSTSLPRNHKGRRQKVVKLLLNILNPHRVSQEHVFQCTLIADRK